MDSVSLRAIARRIGVCGMSRSPWGSGGLGADSWRPSCGTPPAISPAASAPRSGWAARNCSRSRRTMRPFGPVPAIAARSMPRSPAIFRTSGLAKMRPRESAPAWCPLVVDVPSTTLFGGRCAIDHVPDGVVASAEASCGAGVAGVATRAVGAGACAGAGVSVPRAASMSASVSPSATRTAMGSPISPVSPTAKTRRPTTPASSAAYSTSAFSVSISARSWPTATLSPGATSQLAIAASEAPARTDGIRTTEAITAAPHPTGGKQGPQGRFLAMFRRTVARNLPQGPRDPRRRRRRRVPVRGRPPHPRSAR